ncbi:Aldo/keto reductase [Microstroma glucosiphilum]|uniref:Aldo/keto reductase n=1 Tax=Pseudomicrostroma glucosiphilum TaxID=1684307 RepID=A0A316U6Y8_9BASI|nr:Aldo/keto reductase [Pseudomicrostroma glucosiphilum]PWN20201.1 Aldo/keto reductase [Pseudomicrostroma glucosiphilum]
MVKVIVGLMGSSVAQSGSTLSTPAGMRELLDVCRRFGVQELDTARVYSSGRSEELIGEVGAQQWFKISTKAPGFSPGSLQHDQVIANCDASLAALRQDQVDIFYIHGPDSGTPISEVAQAFIELHRRGSYQRFGVSNVSPTVVEELHTLCAEAGSAVPSVYQGAYSPVHRTMEKELLPRLRKLGVAFYAWGPLAGGLLAKPIDQIMNPEKGSRYEAMRAQLGPLYLRPEVLEPLKVLTAKCQEQSIPLAEATLRWHMHHSALGDNDGIILGASTASQLEAGLKACQGGPLSSQLIDAFETLWQAIAPSSSFAWLP